MSNINSLDIDTISRNRIVSETDKNFFVEAGAGSGKTTMLVNRMVAMVEQGKDISKICAITFTKAAANEFYERFQKILIDRSNPAYAWKDNGHAGQLPKPTTESMKRCENALKNIDLCFMGTIDSFCNIVLSEHPSEARIPSDAKIMSDVDIKLLYKQIYVNICSGKYGKELASYAGIFQRMHWNPEDVFLLGMNKFMDNRNVRFKFTHFDEIDIDDTFEKDRTKIIKALECLKKHSELSYRNEAKSIEAWDNLSYALFRLKAKWSSNLNNVIKALNSIKNMRIIPEAMDKYGASLSDCFIPGGTKGAWCEFAPCQAGGLYDKLLKIQYDASMTFIDKCVPVVEQVMRDKGCLSFFDYLYYLRNMLKRSAESDGRLINYIYNRHSYFLIDEFQDTNPMQAEVFFYLTSENPNAKWSDCVPRPGSLFIVGDPKQSIYRFRSADVTSFLKVKSLFEKTGGDILYLSRNFRSTKTLCSYFNDVFAKILPEENINQSRFEEIPMPDRESNGEFEGIFKYKAYTGNAAAAYPDNTDPNKIKDIIMSLVNQEKYLIKDIETGEPRKIRYSDIMVISHGKKNLGPIIEKLDETFIPIKVEGKILFERNVALKEIYKIYRIFSKPENQIALYGALNGRLMGIKKCEITKYKRFGGKISLNNALNREEITDESVLLVYDAIEKIKNISKKVLGMSPAALFAEIMDEFVIYNKAPVKDIEVVYYTLELLRNAEKNGVVVSLKDGADYLSILLNGESDEERCLSLLDNKDCVHLANLHKVKGLEAPIVILAYAYDRDSSPDCRFVHGADGSEGYIFSVNSERDEEGKSKTQFKTEEYKDEKENEKEAVKAEGIRLVYVAATRARNALILCDSVSIRGDKEIHSSRWKPLLEAGSGDIFEAIKDSDEKIPAPNETLNSEKLYEKAINECVLNDRLSEEMTFKVKNPSRLSLVSKLSDDNENDYETDEKTNPKEKESEIHRRFPALLGTMAHKLMEMLITVDSSMDTDRMADEIVSEYCSYMNEDNKLELKAGLKQIADKMKSGGYPQEGSVAQDIVNTIASAEEKYCEVPFCYMDTDENGENTVWNGIIDVIYKSEGKWYIIDYKTNAEGNNLDKKYRSQLEAYKKAFKHIYGEEADAMIYHIDT